MPACSWSTFQVYLYLRGENKTVENHVSVFLFNESEWLVKTRFSVTVKENCLGTARYSCQVLFPAQECLLKVSRFWKRHGKDLGIRKMYSTQQVSRRRRRIGL